MKPRRFVPASDEEMLVLFLHTKIVAPGHTLEELPGVYPDRGLALYKLTDGLMLAVEPQRLASDTVRSVRESQGPSAASGPSASEITSKLQAHPGYCGTVHPPGAPSGGSWLGIRRPFPFGWRREART